MIHHVASPMTSAGNYELAGDRVQMPSIADEILRKSQPTRGVVSNYLNRFSQVASRFNSIQLAASTWVNPQIEFRGQYPSQASSGRALSWHCLLGIPKGARSLPLNLVPEPAAVNKGSTTEIINSRKSARRYKNVIVANEPQQCIAEQPKTRMDELLCESSRTNC